MPVYASDVLKGVERVIPPAPPPVPASRLLWLIIEAACLPPRALSACSVPVATAAGRDAVRIHWDSRGVYFSLLSHPTGSKIFPSVVFNAATTVTFLFGLL